MRDRLAYWWYRLAPSGKFCCRRWCFRRDPMPYPRPMCHKHRREDWLAFMAEHKHDIPTIVWPPPKEKLMTTLTEFLLERIAEDEENARRYVVALPDGDLAPLMLRMLAECEAKRRIVEYFSRSSQAFWGEIALVPLGAIAAVWADHPDYREEWRR